MGALIAAGYIQRQVAEDASLNPEAIFLSAPPVGLGGPAGQILKYSPKAFIQGLANLPVSIRLGGSVDLAALSHDPRVQQDYVNDQFNCLTLHTRLMLQLARASNEVFGRPLRPPCPAYVTVGSEDRVVSPGEIKRFFSQVEKAFKVTVIEGAFHEVHNEIEKYRKPYFEHLKKALSLEMVK
jgi:alpha-beta hydrolase superfamily lysophospholipase